MDGWMDGWMDKQQLSKMLSLQPTPLTTLFFIARARDIDIVNLSVCPSVCASVCPLRSGIR